MTVLEKEGVVLHYSCVRHWHRDQHRYSSTKANKQAVKFIQELNFNPANWVKNRTRPVKSEEAYSFQAFLLSTN